ncbi:hypothetical protein Ahy_B09g099742 [Arachis hypogaea]|uniref:THUMP domain-containing protein n=1 Tax=Arachis hypogaea TaxID=3818 RepID=A0A444XVP6_ARAHY|nr:hypothetical protein Ahy_B09g099742 [Arachis hypogaea]
MAEDGGAATITGRNEHKEREERDVSMGAALGGDQASPVRLQRPLLSPSWLPFGLSYHLYYQSFARPFSKGSYNSLNDLEDDNASKKRRVCTEDDAEECLDNKEKETASATANSGDGKLLSGSGNRAETDAEGVPGLSLVKLTRSGLLLFTFPEDALPDTVDIVSNIIQAYESGSVKSPALLDRNKCFGIVASAVNGVVGDSVVDLRTPELCVLVEVLPISGVPNGSIVVAVSVLPRNLVSTKPRLCVRALNSNTKEGSMAE